MPREFKVIADGKQLKSIAINYDITGKEGIFIKEYGRVMVADVWYKIQIKHTPRKLEFVNNFDIPAEFLEEVL